MNHRELEDPDVKKKVQEELEIEFAKLPSETASVEEEWKIFTTATTSVFHSNCGTKKAGHSCIIQESFGFTGRTEDVA